MQDSFKFLWIYPVFFSQVDGTKWPIILIMNRLTFIFYFLFIPIYLLSTKRNEQIEKILYVLQILYVL